MKKSFLFGIFVLLAMLVSAQNPSEEALLLFKKNQYTKALQTYEELLKSYPNDPEYNYYAALSLFYIRSDWDRCLEYLLKVNTNDYPEEYNYYLGRVYLYLLQPEKAFQRFNLHRNSQSFLTSRNLEIEHWRQASTNTIHALKNIGIIQLNSIDTIQSIGYRYFNSKNQISGSWVEKNELFFLNTGVESENRYVFQPSLLLNTNPCLYFSGKNGLLKNDADIFRFCTEKNELSSQVEELPGTINTKNIEIQPVFDTQKNVLYFSSNRDGGLGGLDIYRVNYYPETNSWGTPQNMGFPVNTPFDEYFLGSGENNTMYISTNRYVAGEKYVIASLQLTNKTRSIDKTDNRKSLAMFGITKANTSEAPRTVPNEETKKTEGEKKGQPYFLNEKKYNQTLERALTLQLKADSVHRISEELRFQLGREENNKKRMDIILAIERYEAEAVEIQKLADVEFSEARKMELAAEKKESMPPIKKPQPENNTSPMNSVIREKLSGSDKSTKEPLESIAPKPLNEFNIHAQSLYSKDNPFNMQYKLPEGLIYRIQLGVFSQHVAFDHFGGIWPITGDWLADRGLTKYYAGLFSKREMAEKALTQIRMQGFLDAFIVAWFRGNKVSLNRASDIEKTLWNKSE